MPKTTTYRGIEYTLFARSFKFSRMSTVIWSNHTPDHEFVRSVIDAVYDPLLDAAHEDAARAVASAVSDTIFKAAMKEYV